MPSLFIDGAWVASGDGTCGPVIDPSDGSVVTEVDVAGIKAAAHTDANNP